MRQALKFAYESGDVRLQDVGYILTRLTPQTAIVAWQYVTDNWTKLSTTFEGTKLLYELIGLPICSMLSPDELADAQKFVELQKTKLANVRNSINQDIESVQKTLEWYSRDCQKVVEWAMNNKP